jgi:indolepyruvate ferredoxin oxidoreductase beta subunit
MDASRPLTLLVAALGGEGGGVLADWIVRCAIEQGLPVQATSVPGVAQRTGSTSYYIETMRAPSPDGAQPVFALSPVPGDVDVVLASELLEAGRMIERGFVHPRRTTLIASSSRVYTTLEKMQMGDGRFDPQRLHDAAHRMSARYVSLDMATLAAEHGTVLSAVMFGALAGSGLLPWPRSACEHVIAGSGIGVQASLAGFAAAFDAVAGASADSGTPSASPASPRAAGPIAQLPRAMREHAALGVARLADYQDAAYADLYLQRLRRLASVAGDPADGSPAAAALSEAARHLALWMSYEDVIRVADLKSRRSRIERIRAESRARDGEVLRVVEYLKPGVEEVAAVLPRRAGAWLRARAARRGGPDALGDGLHLPSTSIHGFFALRLLARLRPIRRYSLRFHEEQAAIERWLGTLERTLGTVPAYAAELAALPRVLKGYGETHRRGRASFARIFDTLVDRALGAGGTPGEAAARELRGAVEAALADPGGRELEGRLEQAGIAPLPPREQPIRWVRKPRAPARAVVP